LTLKYVAFVAASFVLLNGGLGLPFSVSILVTIAGGVTWWRSVDSAWENFCHFVESDQGKQRMRTPGIRGNESVEWLNGVLTKLWPQVNTDIFVPIVDLLEDVMQASIPSFITQVKIVNVGQGVTPLRVLSMRWLDEENQNDSKAADTKHGATDRLNEEEQMGEWASLEVSFAYRAQPSSSSAQSKAKNANLLVHFYMGLNGFFGTPLPVWVELRGATGTCRMKIQLIPDPPFVKLGTFTLLGMPKIEVAAVPMNQRFFNVMNLPIVSDFIYSSIRAAAKRFVAPSNYTLDLAKILIGDDTKKELLAIGVLVVHIHSATGVMAADVNGKSDCYATLAYSKCRKPIWSSRIIFNELNPVWDETAVLLLDSGEVKAAEGLSLQLYDSDRFTADDMLGRTEIDVARIIRNPGKVWEREDNLMGIKDGSSMPGTVKWSVVYHGIRRLDKSLETKVVEEKLPQDLEVCFRSLQ
jgi:Ca2+-dependent lipid-binding protein